MTLQHFYLVVAIATTSYYGGVEHIPVVIYVSSCADSLKFERSSVFPREELRSLIELYRR